MRPTQPRRSPAPPRLLPQTSLRRLAHSLVPAKAISAAGLLKLLAGLCLLLMLATPRSAQAQAEIQAQAETGTLAQASNNCPPGYTNNGLTCGRGAETIPNGGSTVADCPAGYTNNGATCGRGAETIANGGSSVADCPAGYTNNGATCGRGASTIGNGGSILADCPAGFKNMGASCYRVSPPRSLSMDSMTCPGGWNRRGGRCYRDCPEGYTNTGVSCFRPASTLGMDSMTCPAGTFKSGARCYRPCPTGYTNTGVSCFRPASTLGMDSMTCPAGTFKSGARCYKPCPIGFTNTGVSCFRPVSTVPRNPNINWEPSLPDPRQKFYNIGHMANTDSAAKWAVSQGANGLEMDLNFDSQGRPESFKHGGVCDCSCNTTTENICDNGLSNSCNASSNPSQHLRFIATLPGLALVYIDSKVDLTTHPEAGREVVRLLERDLFGAGFQGVVIIGAPDTTSAPYLSAAVREAGSAAHASRYFFGFDMVRGPANLSLDVLKAIPGSPNLVYSTGITSCIPPTYYSEISGGVANRSPGPVSLTGIWTLDLERSMILYLQLGVNAIVTNRPGVLREVLRQTRPDLRLAVPTDSPPLRR